jgi:hypothetical protein
LPDINVRLDKPDGTSETVTIDLSLDTLTMRESVRLETVLGEDTFSRIVSEGLDGAANLTSPKIIQGLIYVKLKTLHPEVELDEFDLDLEDLEKALFPKGPEPSGEGSSG